MRRDFKMFLFTIICILSLAMVSVSADSDENWVSNLSPEEFQDLQRYRMPDISEFKPYPEVDPDREFPEVWWREMGGVSSIKNQGPCGSCWAFTALDTTDSAVIGYDLIEWGW